MRALRSIEQLAQFQQELAARPRPEVAIRVCATGCRALGALEVCEALEQETARLGVRDRVRVVRTGCHGLCAGAVTVVVSPFEFFYLGVTPDDAGDIVRAALEERAVERLCWSQDGQPVARRDEIPFFRHQTRLVLRNCGVVDPRSLEDALAHGAYGMLARILATMSPEQVIDEVLRSGLRGRGGAGFPTGRKWQLAREARGEPKYVICNADEGDPGAFMDRALLEGDPHLVIEGMLTGAYAIGATKGYIYVRAEYPIAIEHTELALAQAREAGLLGENILGTGFSFDLEVRKGAGAFVCGEETALIASIEGRRGMPRPRPPFPAQSGLWGKPTNINNVETWANVPRIIELGAEAYARVGTEGSKGTKIFALAGKVRHTGLVEVPMGTTLRQLVFDIGGGIPRGRSFKAAQMGGPSGGCVPAKYLDLPIDYDSVKQVGAIMGSGGLIVMDEATCMVDIARFFTDFVQSESCGKCVPCRIGTRRMLEMLQRACRGEGDPEDIDRLASLGEMVAQTSLCGLGQTAPNPVLSTIRHFRREYEAHLREQRCPAHVCKPLVTTTCRDACPAHVNVPEYVGLIAEGRFAEALEVVRRRNPFPSVCGRACHHPCELFCRRGDVDEPVAIRHLKRFAADYEGELAVPRGWSGRRHGRVAVVGAGPAGLTAAYFLALMGREVKVFEASSAPGGMMAWAIPPYRLPRAALQRDIAYICAAGVEIETNHRINSLGELGEFDAVFLAVGAHRPVRLRVPGEEAAGVLDALSFLRAVAEGRIGGLGGRVVVIGGGNAAIDSARTALRLGASSVTILYRRTREEMPAADEEVEEALEEGVEVCYLVSPVEIQAGERVEGVHCVEMELGETEESGRRRPVPKPGSARFFPADQVIVAVGQTPDLSLVQGDDRVMVRDGRLAADAVTQQVGDGPIFAGGDAVTGPATLIEAIGAGQRAARAIDRFLGGRGELPIDQGYASRSKPEEAEGGHRRLPVAKLPPEERRHNFRETAMGYSAAEACQEARRCLRCDLEQ